MLLNSSSQVTEAEEGEGTRTRKEGLGPSLIIPVYRLEWDVVSHTQPDHSVTTPAP